MHVLTFHINVCHKAYTHNTLSCTHIMYVYIITAVLSLSLVGVVHKSLNSFQSILTPCHDIISPKKGKRVHLYRQLSLLSFRFDCLHICSTFSSISSLSLPCSSNFAIKSSSAVSKKFGILLNKSSIFSGTYLHLGPSKWSSLNINTCQMDMKSLLNMTICHLVLSYDILSLYLLM